MANGRRMTAELAADFAQHADLTEPKALVDGARRVVRERDGGDGHVHVLAAHRIEDRLVQALSRCACPTASGAETIVISTLVSYACEAGSGWWWCSPRTTPSRSATSRRWRPGCGVVREPLAALVDGPRLEVERDRRVDDVVVVDLGDARDVGDQGGAHGDLDWRLRAHAVILAVRGARSGARSMTSR